MAGITIPQTGSSTTNETSTPALGSSFASPTTPVSSDFMSGGSLPNFTPAKVPTAPTQAPAVNTASKQSLQNTYNSSYNSNNTSGQYTNPYQNSNITATPNYNTISTPEDYLKNLKAFGTSSDANASADRSTFVNGQADNKNNNDAYGSGASSAYQNYLNDLGTRNAYQGLSDVNGQLKGAVDNYTNLMTASKGSGGFGNIDAGMNMALNRASTSMEGLKSLATAYTGQVGTALDYANKATNGIWNPKLQQIQNATNFQNQNQGLFNTEQGNAISKAGTMYQQLGQQYTSARDDQTKARDMLVNGLQNGASNDPVARAIFSQLAQKHDLSTADILNNPAIAKYMRPSGYLTYDSSTGATVNTATGDATGLNYQNPTGTATSTGLSANGQAIVNSTLQMAGMTPEMASQSLASILSDPQKASALISAINKQEGGTPQGTNNLGNMLYAGQAGATQGKSMADITGNPADANKHFANFNTPQDYQNAATNQLGLYAQRGMSVGDAIATWKGVAGQAPQGNAQGDMNSKLSALTAGNPTLAGTMNSLANYQIDPSSVTGTQKQAYLKMLNAGVNITPEGYKWVQGQNDITSSGKNFALIKNSMDSLAILKNQLATVKDTNTTSPQFISQALSSIGVQLNDEALTKAIQTGSLVSSDLAKVVLPSGGTSDERSKLTVSILSGNKASTLAQIKNVATLMKDTYVPQLGKEGMGKNVDPAFIGKTYIQGIAKSYDEINK